MFKERFFNTLGTNRNLHALIFGAFLCLMSADIFRHFQARQFDFPIIMDLTIALLVVLLFMFTRKKIHKHLCFEKELEGKMQVLRLELDQWKQKSSAFLQEFETIISAHFDVWGLTNAEKDIALLLVKGMSFSEIASLRGTSSNTVRNQAHTIYAKSNLKSRTELAAYFMEELLNSK